jgi:hypothetical protein
MFAHSLKVCGLGMVQLMTACAGARFNPHQNKRIVPCESLSHCTVSYRWSKVAMYVSRSLPIILMVRNFDNASSLFMVSVNACWKAKTNQSHRALSSLLLTAGIGGFSFGYPLTCSTVCPTIR